MTDSDRPPRLLLVAVALLSATAAFWTARPLTIALVDKIRLGDPVMCDADILNIERETVAAGDGTIQQVWVTFRYDFLGRTYELRTQRLAIFHDSDKYMAELEHAWKQGDPVLCYVATSKPSLCVFSLDFSVSSFLITSLFPLFFTAVTIMVTISIFRIPPR